MTVNIRGYFQAHPYHLVSPSLWPTLISISLLGLTGSAVSLFHGFNGSGYLLSFSLTAVLGTMTFWFRDIIAEGTYSGHHTLAVQRGISMGILLFIVSEALFFVSVFWAYFHSALSPTVELGAQWPPMGIEAVNAFELPLLNTVLLLASGVTITLAHHGVISGDRNLSLFGILATLFLAAIFTTFQGIEYGVSSFTISDGTYGSVFYFATGFHGFHVIIGTIFIGVGLWRLYAYHFTTNHHLGLEGGILYWHFVDVVWLILYLAIYYWGS